MALDATSEKIQNKFESSQQFGKGLIPIQANPTNLLEFLESSAWQPTWSCIGGVFSYILNTFGRDEFNKTLAKYSHRDSLKILEPLFRGDVKERIMQSTF